MKCIKDLTKAANKVKSAIKMPFSADYITKKLQEELSTTHLDVKDVSDGCGAKFDCVIVSDKFDGKSLLQRHRLVNEVLKEEMKDIHAFTMKTLTSQQFEKLDK